MRDLSKALAVAALILSFAPRDGRAAGSYDPDVPYRAVTSPNFYVVHAKGYEHIALRSAAIAESLLPGMVARFGYRPQGRITIVVDDQNDFANGTATVFPNKIITIYVTAPTEVSGLEDYDDWLYSVIDHELAHIVHLDMVFGLPVIGRFIFGKYIALNQYTPAWLSEGLAVYEETYSSGAGRGRSAYADMVIRVAALEDRFPHIDQGYRAYAYWPFSNVAYFIGGRFQAWLAYRFGEEALMRYHRIYAETPVPYLTWWAAFMAFDDTFEALWLTFEAEMKEDALLTQRLVRSSTLAETIPDRLTRYGGDLLGPKISKDGKHIFFSTNSPKDGPRIRRIDLDGGNDTVLVNDTFSKALSFTPDGSAFYYQQTEINQRFYFHNSLLRYDLKKEETELLRLDERYEKEFLAPSGSLRARDPDVSPSGTSIVFVQTPYAANRLVLARLGSDGLTLHPKVIVPAEPDVQLSNPRFSPDGRSIAVSRFRAGRRDVVIYDREGALVETITRDRAQDVDPTWSPDGRWLVFASDRTGIYNLYAFELESQRLLQLTNLMTGAYQPSISPDGRTIVFRGYSADGFDVYRVPFEPERGTQIERVLLPEEGLDDKPRRWPALSLGLPEKPPPAPFKNHPVPAPFELPEGWTMGEYSVDSTLLPFNDNWNLIPEMSADETELFMRLSHFGRDALETQTYLVWGTYRTSTNFFGGGAIYQNDAFEPTFTIGGDADTRLFVLRDTEGNRLFDYTELRLLGSLSVSLPFRRRHLISLGYQIEGRSALNEVPDDVYEAAARLPADGRFARVRLGYSYSNVRAFAHSISIERGYELSFAISGLSKGLGSDYEQIVLGGDARGYLSMPASLLPNHVLAASLSISAGLGPDLVELFRLGGAAGQSALTTTTQNFFGLRGMQNSILAGLGVIHASLEYRAPIWRVERGFGTAPLAIRAFHAALFADTGRVFQTLEASTLFDGFFDAFAIGAGAELRADLLLGHALGLQVRVGYAHLLRVPGGEDRDVIDASGPFFQLGSLF